MARVTGAKTKSKELGKNIYYIHCVGVRVTNICKHCKMKQPTVSNTISRYRNAQRNCVRKRMGLPLNLSPRGMKLLQKYVMGNCFNPVQTIVAKFNAANALHLSKSTAHRYIRKFNIKSCIAMQKPYLSKNNKCARVIWGPTYKDWTLQQ